MTFVMKRKTQKVDDNKIKLEQLNSALSNFTKVAKMMQNLMAQPTIKPSYDQIFKFLTPAYEELMKQLEIESDSKKIIIDEFFYKNFFEIAALSLEKISYSLFCEKNQLFFDAAFLDAEKNLKFHLMAIALIEKVFANCRYKNNRNNNCDLNISNFPGLIQIYCLCSASTYYNLDKLDNAYKNLRKSYLYMKQLKRLGEKTRYARLLDPFYTTYYSMMGKILIKQNQLSKAKKYAACLDSFVENRTGDCALFVSRFELTELYRRIANFYKEKNDYTNALSYYELSIELAIATSDCLDKLTGLEAGFLQACKLKLNEIWKFKKDSEDDIKKIQKLIIEENTTNLFNFLKGNEIKYEIVNNKSQETLLINFNSLEQESAFLNVFKGQVKQRTLGVEFNILDFNINDFGKLKKIFLQALKPKENEEATVEQAIDERSTLESNSPSSQEEKYLKKQRHEERLILQKENEEKNQKNEKNITDEKMEIKEVKYIKWNHSYIPNGTMYRVYGNENIITYAIIIEDVIPIEARKKFIDVAKHGNVLGQNSSQNRQGYFFSKTDEVIKKHGKQYGCKLKVQGAESDHRVIGRQIATGGLFCKLNEKETQVKSCEVWLFDKYEHTHRKNK